MQYYKVQPGPMNFLPQIRFDRDDSLSGSEEKFKQQNVSQSAQNLQGMGRLSVRENLPQKDAYVLSNKRKSAQRLPHPIKYRLPELGTNHSKLLLRVEQRTNSVQNQEKNLAIKLCMEQILLEMNPTHAREERVITPNEDEKQIDRLPNSGPISRRSRSPQGK